MSIKERSHQDNLGEDRQLVDIDAVAQNKREMVKELFSSDDPVGREALGNIDKAAAESDPNTRLSYLTQVVAAESSSIFALGPEIVQLLNETNNAELQQELRNIMTQSENERDISEIAAESLEIMQRVTEVLMSLHKLGIVRDEFMNALMRMQTLQKNGVDLDVVEDIDLLGNGKAVEMFGAHDPRRYSALSYQFGSVNNEEKAGKYGRIALLMHKGGPAKAIFEQADKMLEVGARGDLVLPIAIGALKFSPSRNDVSDCVDAFLQHGHQTEALSICREWHEKNPNDPERLLLLVITLMESGQEDEAVKVLTGMGELDTSEPELAEAIGMLQNLKSLILPDATPNEDFVYDESSAFSNSYMAAMMQRQGKEEEALVYMERALAIEPNDEDQRHLIVSMYASLGNYPKVVDHLKVLIHQDPNNPTHLEFMSQAYHSMDELGQAEVFARQVLELEPTAGRYAKLATLRLIKRDPESIELYEKALEMEPNNLSILASLGIAYLSNDRPEEAFEVADKATELTSKDSQGYMLLARLFQQLGEQEEAIKYIERAIKLDPTNTMALEARQKIMKDEEIKLN